MWHAPSYRELSALLSLSLSLFLSLSLSLHVTIAIWLEQRQPSPDMDALNVGEEKLIHLLYLLFPHRLATRQPTLLRCQEDLVLRWWVLDLHRRQVIAAGLVSETIDHIGVGTLV